MTDEDEGAWTIDDEPTVLVNGEETNYTPNGDTVRELVKRVVKDQDFRTADVKIDGSEVSQNSNMATNEARQYDRIEVNKHTTVG